MGVSRHFPHRLRLLFEDAHCAVVEKDAGYLSCDIRGGSRPNALDALSDYFRRGVAKSRARAWLVHRLDRDTSGVMVFAKSMEARDALQESWGSVEKIYFAALSGVPAVRSGMLENWLSEDGDFYVHCFDRPSPGAKVATLEYSVKAVCGRARSLAAVRLHTGRKNQIRVQFAGIGHPVLGDVKYGRGASDGARRLMLHAYSLSFTHPATGERLSFQSPAPADFGRMFPDAFDKSGRSLRA